MSKTKLTWCADQDRWRKIYRGKIYYFKRDPYETKEESYRRCLHEWEKQKVTLDGADPKIPKTTRTVEFAQNVLNELADVRLVLTGFDEETDPASSLSDRIEWAEKQIDQLIRKVAQTKARTGVMVATSGMIEANALPSIIRDTKREIDGLKLEVQRTELPRELRLSENIKAYLECRKRTPTATANIRKRLETFAEFFGADRNVKEITETVVDRYVSTIKKKVDSGQIVPRTGAAYVADLFGMLKKCYVRGVIPTLPRNLSDPDLRIASTPKKVESMPIDMVRGMIEQADDQVRLFLLLHLNCGYIYSDISELRQGEVDWTKGVITRKRTKTAGHESVPIVSYVLWDETFSLLKKYRNKDHAKTSRVLVDEHGQPLHYSELDSRGKSIRCRTLLRVVEKYLDHLVRIGVEHRPIRQLRGTASSLIDRYPKRAGYGELFLGHSPKGTADRHYLEPDWKTFHEALVWMGNQFGFQTSKR